MPRRYSDREDDDGRYRLREREQSTCASGSCSEYGNYLTVRPDFPSRNDIRNRRSYYNRDRHGSDIDVIYESKSYPSLDPSVRATRQNSISRNESSELVSVVNSRDIGADSHFIQSRLGIQRKKNINYVYTRRGKYVRNRTDSESSFERFSPERIRVSPVREAKEWLGPLDKANDKPFKIKVSKLRSSPERSSSNNHLIRHSRSPPRVKLLSRSTSPLIRPKSPSPEKKRMSRSTSPFDIPTKNLKLKRRSSPPKKDPQRNSLKSESDLKLFPLLRKKKKEYEPKSREKSAKKKEERPQSRVYSPEKDSSVDEFPSHRRDTIASRLKQKKVFKYPIPFADSSYTEEEVDSKYVKRKIETEDIQEKAAELIEMVKNVVGKPDRRRTKYFDSNLKVGREGKMRKLDVSSDCKLKSCDDKKPKKRMNFGKKYGRYAYEPPRENKYLSESKDKMKTRKSTEKDRVSFKEPEVPEEKHKSSFKLNTALLKRSSLKKKLKMFRKSPSPPESSSLEKATQSNLELAEKEETPKIFEKTLSEDSTKKFYHKTVLENYPDETDHLRNYHEEFRKDRFKSEFFNPTDHNPPVILPSVYPKAKKRYNYSGILEPDTKRKPSSTTYVKREPRKDSESKNGESFFDLSINNKSKISEEVLTKEDIKEEKKDDEIFRPISFASIGEEEEEEEEEITMPNNEVVSTILEIEEPPKAAFKEQNIEPSFQSSPEPKLPEKKEREKTNNEHVKNTHKEQKRRKTTFQEKEKQKDWRFRKKVDLSELKMLGRKPSEVELASDERLVPDIVGHAAMHNWEQAENYHLTRNKYKMYVPRIVKRQQARERREREMERMKEMEEEEENDEMENEKTENNVEEETEEIVRPTPKKRFRGKRINPRSRFDGGYDLLQVADSDTSVEMDNAASRIFVMPKPEKKKEGTISKFAKRLFTAKRNEESKEDLENSINKTSQNSKPPKRKVSFSFPPSE